MKSSKPNNKFSVATIFFEASSLRYFSQRALLTTNAQPELVKIIEV